MMTDWNWKNVRATTPGFLGIDTFDATNLASVRPYFNWTAFFAKWDFPVSFPDVLQDDEWGHASQNLYRDANAFIDELASENLLRPTVTFGVWRASAENDTVIVRTEQQPPVRLRFPRLSADTTGSESYCLADFIKPEACLEPGESDYLGGYVISLGDQLSEKWAQFMASDNQYFAYLLEDLSSLYGSAIADFLHYRLRRFIWAYCDDDDLSNQEIIDGVQPGIRVEIGQIECPDQSAVVSLCQLLAIDPVVFTSKSPDQNNLTLGIGGYFFAHPHSRLADTTGNSRQKPNVV